MVVDTLLRLIEAQRADALVLPSDGPPYLATKGERKPLSMPPLGHEVLNLVLEDIASGEERDRLAQTGRLEVRYPFEEQVYTALVEQQGTRLQIRFQRSSQSIVGSHTPAIIDRAPQEPETTPDTVPEVRESKAVVAALGDVLTEALSMGASDVFLSVGRAPVVRVGERLHGLAGVSWRDEDFAVASAPWLDDHDRARLQTEGSLDLALAASPETGNVRWRAHLFRQHHGWAIAFRPIRREPPSLRELNLPDELYDLVRVRNGLVLVSGATGSGKSTTLVALIERINRSEPRHIVTLEDPIEYEYRPQRALIHQRELGRHVSSFAEGLRGAMRQSPDVILVGEMRDRDTMAAALTAAETGHLVLSTIHAGSAVMALERLIDAFPEHQHGPIRMQLASCLRAVMTQTLIPARQSSMRVPAFELLRINTAVAAKLREGRIHQLQTEIQTGRASGMISMESRLAELVRQGFITVAVAREAASDRTLLEQHLHGG